MQQVLLPQLPAGFRWHKKQKRAWTFLTLQKRKWWGWKTIKTTSLNPLGLGLAFAMNSAAGDLMEAAGL